MRRPGALLGLGFAVCLAACGGGGGGEDEDAIVLFEDSFDGVFPGTAWTPFGAGAMAVDGAVGSPPPSLRLGGGGSAGVLFATDSFDVATGLTLRFHANLAIGGEMTLGRPDSSTFVEVHALDADTLFVNAAGAGSGFLPLAVTGAFHTFEVRIAPGAAAVAVLLDGSVLRETSTPFNPPPTVRLRLFGDTDASSVFDEVLVTTP